MITWLLKQLNRISQPYRLIVYVIIVVALGMIVFTLFSQVSSCQYDKSRKEFEEKDKARDARVHQLQGQILERDRQIAELEIEKQAYRSMAEQGVRADQEKAKQIEEISAKEAQDLEQIRGDMDCRTRVERTVALLRTAKPPINLDLNAVIRKQCG